MPTGVRERSAALHELHAQLAAGGGFTELTGLAQPASEEERAAGVRAYHRLVRICHPDLCSGEAELAGETFTQLQAAWGAWEQPQVVLQTRTGRYEVGARRWGGEVCAVFAVTPAPAETEVSLRLPHSPDSNDLMVAEAQALRRLGREAGAQASYFPALTEQIRHRDETGAERRVNIITRVCGLVSLAEVRDTYPDGVDPRDAAWMWRRGLVALGAAHRAGLVHSSPWPEHIWIQPREHGVVLDGWWYSTEAGGRLSAALTSRVGEYPGEMLVEATAGPGEDIFILTKAMAELIGERMPAPLQRFVRGCTLGRSQRPQDAWSVLAELDDLLERMWGRRRFREFSMPEVSG